MNAPSIIVPPRQGSGGRGEAVHRAIYIAYMIEGLDAESVADKVNAAHGTFEGRNSITSYANRQGWLKHTGSGPKAKPKAMRPPTPPRVRPERPPPSPKAPPAKPKPRAGLDYVAEVAEAGGFDPDEERYRAKVWPANENSRPLAELEPFDPVTERYRLECKFPVGPDCPGHMDDHLFCGRPREDGHLYCVPHEAIAFSPAAAKKVRPHDIAPSPRRNSW